MEDWDYPCQAWKNIKKKKRIWLFQTVQFFIFQIDFENSFFKL